MGRITCSLGCSTSREADIKTFHVTTARTVEGICIKYLSLSPKLLVTQAKRVKCSIPPAALTGKGKKTIGRTQLQDPHWLMRQNWNSIFPGRSWCFHAKKHLILLKILSESISVGLSSVVQWKVFFMSI